MDQGHLWVVPMRKGDNSRDRQHPSRWESLNNQLASHTGVSLENQSMSHFQAGVHNTSTIDIPSQLIFVSERQPESRFCTLASSTPSPLFISFFLPHHRSFTSLHPHTCHLRRPPSSNCTCYQLWYADGILFPHRILWFADSRYGWHDRRRPLHSEEACIWNDPLGCIRCICAKSRSTRTFLSAQSGSSCGSLLQLSSCYSSSTLKPPRPTSSTKVPAVSTRLPETLGSCPLQRSV